MPAHDPAEPLCTLAHALLVDLNSPLLAPFLAAWPQRSAPPPGGARTAAPVAPALAPAAAPSTLPVLRWLPAIGTEIEARGGIGAALAGAVCRAGSSLAWRQTYRPDELDSAFLNNYGWTQMFPTEPTAAGVACGLLLLGPHTHYPAHAHEAEEVYVPLYGTAEWLKGDGPWRAHAPGALIHHRRDEPHAMRTADAPLLALYLWRSDNLLQQARLIV